MTTPHKDWPYVCRIIWLSGGIVAVNNPGASVQIHAGINGPVLYEFQLQTYTSLIHMLAQEGFPVMGVTFIQDVDEVKGVRPPEFRAWVGWQRPWRVSDSRQQWRQIAHAAAQENKMAAMDIASRIASELMYSEMRLLSLSEAYSTQLSGRAQQGVAKKYERFEDLNSPPIYLAIHALFWELAVLRDNLAEFAAKFLFGFEQIATFRGLHKKLSQHKYPDDDLAIEFLTAGGEAGWLTTFTAYRNLFTHSAPMKQAAGIAFAVLDQIAITDGRSAPQLYYALPSNIQELVKRRSSGMLYENFDELIAASAERQPIRETEPDALHYLHGCLSQMAILSEQLVQRSPIAPKIIHFTDADIIGSVQIINR